MVVWVQEKCKMKFLDTNLEIFIIVGESFTHLTMCTNFSRATYECQAVTLHVKMLVCKYKGVISINITH